MSYSPFDGNTEDTQFTRGEFQELQRLENSISFPFKVAFVSDTHNNYDELEKIVSYINDHADEYAFVVHVGDFTTYGTAREYEVFKRITSQLQRPLFVVAGNHDLLNNGKTVFKNVFGPLNYSFTFKNIRMIFLANSNWELLGAPDYDWLESTLSRSSSDRHILVMHIPPLDRNRFSEEEQNRILRMANTASYKVSYLVNAHTHETSGYSPFGSAGARTFDTGEVVSQKFFFSLAFSVGGVNEEITYY